jgi:hypothetical protein
MKARLKQGQVHTCLLRSRTQTGTNLSRLRKLDETLQGIGTGNAIAMTTLNHVGVGGVKPQYIEST